jgi:hypothetical protein
MAKGGARPGSGRKLGSATTKTREIANALAANGLTPLEHMLQVLRDPDSSASEKQWAAQNAAPYIHPKLSSVQVGGDQSGVPIQHAVRVEFVKKA